MGKMVKVDPQPTPGHANAGAEFAQSLQVGGLYEDRKTYRVLLNG
jgi:hypothetical protein